MKPISSFMLRSLVSETRPLLVGTFLDKFQQVGKETFKLSFRTKDGKKDLLIEPGVRLNVTTYNIEAPKTPSNFSLQIKKRIAGHKLLSIEQHRFDRVVTMDFGEYKLILEFFSHGNIILTDPKLTVVNAFRQETWKDREIRRGKPYAYPTGGLDVTTATKEEFANMFKGDAVHSLAKNIGGKYAEEACSRAKVKPDATPNEKEKDALFKAVRSMLDEPINPALQDGELHPFTLSGAVEKSFASANEAVDESYLYVPEKQENPRIGELERRLKEQEDALTKFEKQAEDYRAKGDLIKQNYVAVEQLKVTGALAGARKSGRKIIIDLS